MSTPVISTVLDEAFERMAASSAFELPNGFVNHGPMGCEALAAMGLDAEIDQWARRFERVPGPAVVPVAPARLEWKGAMGNYGLLPEWIGYLEAAIDEHGWLQVVQTWVPRLSPGLSTKLFHGVIHVAHAVRALTVADTSARRAELARALGYWAARHRHGQPQPANCMDADDLRAEVVGTAERAARYYLAAPSILHLHGVTGAMALELLVDHLPPPAGQAALAQLTAEHTALYRGIRPNEDVHAGEVSPLELARAAAQSGDVHQVKLVEACQRALEISGSPVFAAAAQVVTG
ncbi:MAG: hypothetical protein ACRDYY_11160 [Acidimicrobiales bacterium]